MENKFYELDHITDEMLDEGDPWTFTDSDILRMSYSNPLNGPEVYMKRSICFYYRALIVMKEDEIAERVTYASSTLPEDSILVTYAPVA